MEHKETKYSCDKCGKNLRTCDNEVCIVTQIDRGGGAFWSRFKVRIEYHSGVHNDAKVRNADLCQKCAVALFEDAFKRVTKGERTTKGHNSIDEGKFK
jgi:hypothetical protein